MAIEVECNQLFDFIIDNFYFSNDKCLDINMIDARGYDCLSLLMYQDFSSVVCFSQFGKKLSCGSHDIWKFNQDGLCPIDFINYQLSKNKGANSNQLKLYLCHLIKQYRPPLGQLGVSMQLFDVRVCPPGALNFYLKGSKQEQLVPVAVTDGNDSTSCLSNGNSNFN